MDPEEIVNELNLDEIQDRDWSIFGCSATEGVGIPEGLEWLVNQLDA